MSTADEIRLKAEIFNAQIDNMVLAMAPFRQAVTGMLCRRIEADLRQDAVALMRWDDDGGPSVETIWVFSLPDIRFA